MKKKSVAKKKSMLGYILLLLAVVVIAIALFWSRQNDAVAGQAIKAKTYCPKYFIYTPSPGKGKTYCSNYLKEKSITSVQDKKITASYGCVAQPLADAQQKNACPSGTLFDGLRWKYTCSSTLPFTPACLPGYHVIEDFSTVKISDDDGYQSSCEADDAVDLSPTKNICGNQGIYASIWPNPGVGYCCAIVE